MTETKCGVCTPCNPGKEKIGCGGKNEGVCTLCPAGWYKQAGTIGEGALYTSKCEKCEAGKSTNGQAGTDHPNKCLDCVPGSFSTTSGSPSCENCQSGQYTDVPGSNKCAKCSKCNAGYQCYTAITGAKLLCGGSYLDSTTGRNELRSSAGICNTCPNGRFKPDSLGGAYDEQCSICDNGKTHSPTRDACILCPLPTVGSTGDGLCGTTCLAKDGKYPNLARTACLSLVVESVEIGQRRRRVNTLNRRLPGGTKRRLVDGSTSPDNPSNEITVKVSEGLSIYDMDGAAIGKYDSFILRLCRVDDLICETPLSNTTGTKAVSESGTLRIPSQGPTCPTVPSAYYIQAGYHNTDLTTGTYLGDVVVARSSDGDDFEITPNAAPTIPAEKVVLLPENIYPTTPFFSCKVEMSSAIDADSDINNIKLSGVSFDTAVKDAGISTAWVSSSLRANSVVAPIVSVGSGRDWSFSANYLLRCGATLTDGCGDTSVTIASGTIRRVKTLELQPSYGPAKLSTAVHIVGAGFISGSSEYECKFAGDGRTLTVPGIATNSSFVRCNTAGSKFFGSADSQSVALRGKVLKYQGCFSGRDVNRVSTLARVGGTKVRASTCQYMCYAKSPLYDMYFLHGGACFCGKSNQNQLPSAPIDPMLNEGACSLTCPTLSNEETPEHLGCFRDVASGRDLPVDGIFVGSLDVSSCSEACVGYAFFGIQAGASCFCGNSYGKYGNAQGDCPLSERNDIYQQAMTRGSSGLKSGIRSDAVDQQCGSVTSTTACDPLDSQCWESSLLLGQVSIYGITPSTLEISAGYFRVSASPPGTIRPPTVTDVPGGVSVSWLPPVFLGGSSDVDSFYYKILYQCQNCIDAADNADVQEQIVRTQGVLSDVVLGLKPNKLYSFRVVAKNKVDWGDILPPEEASLADAGEAVPPEPPAMLSLSTVNADSVTLSFPPSEYDGGVPITHYYVKYTMKGEGCGDDTGATTEQGDKLVDGTNVWTVFTNKRTRREGLVSVVVAAGSDNSYSVASLLDGSGNVKITIREPWGEDKLENGNWNPNTYEGLKPSQTYTFQLYAFNYNQMESFRIPAPALEITTDAATTPRYICAPPVASASQTIQFKGVDVGDVEYEMAFANTGTFKLTRGSESTSCIPFNGDGAQDPDCAQGGECNFNILAADIKTQLEELPSSNNGLIWQVEVEVVGFIAHGDARIIINFEPDQYASEVLAVVDWTSDTSCSGPQFGTYNSAAHVGQQWTNKVTSNVEATIQSADSDGCETVRAGDVTTCPTDGTTGPWDTMPADPDFDPNSLDTNLGVKEDADACSNACADSSSCESSSFDASTSICSIQATAPTAFTTPPCPNLPAAFKWTLDKDEGTGEKAAGQVFKLRKGTHILTDQLYFPVRNMKLLGYSPVDTIVQCAPDARCLVADSAHAHPKDGITFAALIANIKFKGGFAKDFGGAILIEGATRPITFRNVVMEGNKAAAGGGIAIMSVTARVDLSSGVFLTNNQALYFGGGLLVVASQEVRLQNAEISSNSAQYGGGIATLSETRLISYLPSSITATMISSSSSDETSSSTSIEIRSSLTLDASVLEKNKATLTSEGSGGALYSYESDVSFVNSASVRANVATVSGGGCFFQASSVSIAESTLASNKVNGGRGKGGGFSCISSTVKVRDSTFESNTAGQDGGAVSATFCPVILNGVQVTANKAISGKGGGLNVELMCEVSIKDTVFESNQAQLFGGGIFAEEVLNLRVSASTFTKNSAGSQDENDNEDKGGGGSIATFSSQNIKIVNTIFNLNRANGAAGGGALHLDVGDIEVGSLIDRTKNETKNIVGLSHKTCNYCWQSSLATSKYRPVVSDCNFTSNKATVGGGGAAKWLASEEAMTNLLPSRDDLILWTNNGASGNTALYGDVTASGPHLVFLVDGPAAAQAACGKPYFYVPRSSSYCAAGNQCPTFETRRSDANRRLENGGKKFKTPLRVEVLDFYGRTIKSSRAIVQVVPDESSDIKFGGTVNIVAKQGVAIFEDLTVNEPPTDGTEIDEIQLLQIEESLQTQQIVMSNTHVAMTISQIVVSGTQAVATFILEDASTMQLAVDDVVVVTGATDSGLNTRWTVTAGAGVDATTFTFDASEHSFSTDVIDTGGGNIIGVVSVKLPTDTSTTYGDAYILKYFDTEFCVPYELHPDTLAVLIAANVEQIVSRDDISITSSGDVTSNDRKYDIKITKTTEVVYLHSVSVDAYGNVLMKLKDSPGMLANPGLLEPAMTFEIKGAATANNDPIWFTDIQGNNNGQYQIETVSLDGITMGFGPVGQTDNTHIFGVLSQARVYVYKVGRPVALVVSDTKCTNVPNNQNSVTSGLRGIFADNDLESTVSQIQQAKVAVIPNNLQGSFLLGFEFDPEISNEEELSSKSCTTRAPFSSSVVVSVDTQTGGLPSATELENLIRAMESTRQSLGLVTVSVEGATALATHKDMGRVYPKVGDTVTLSDFMGDYVDFSSDWIVVNKPAPTRFSFAFNVSSLNGTSTGQWNGTLDTQGRATLQNSVKVTKALTPQPSEGATYAITFVGMQVSGNVPQLSVESSMSGDVARLAVTVDTSGSIRERITYPAAVIVPGTKNAEDPPFGARLRDCVPGEYLQGGFECTSCAAGRYSNESNAFACSPCGAGTAQPYRGRDMCYDCAVGAAQPSIAGQAECISCEQGMWTDGTEGNSICADECPAGTHGKQVFKKVYQYCQKQQATQLGENCADCPTGWHDPTAGSYCLKEVTQEYGDCVSCPTGT